MRTLDLIATILLIIGGLNWGLVAFDINLVTKLFPEQPTIINAIYMLVGSAAIYRTIMWKPACNR